MSIARFLTKASAKMRPSLIISMWTARRPLLKVAFRAKLLLNPDTRTNVAQQSILRLRSCSNRMSGLFIFFATLECILVRI